MEMNKLQRYNQKLLAAIGTIIVAFGLVGLIALIVTLISEISWDRRSDKNSGLLADEVTEELAHENLRQQILSYDMPRLVDTFNLVYLIPVSQKNLDNPEEIDEGVLGIMDTRPKFGSGKRYSGSRIYGAHNNILIYDYKTQSIIKLFDSRVFIGNIDTEYFEDDILLVFKGVRFDSDNDGVINLKDYNSLFVYSISKNSLQELSISKMDVLSYQFVQDKKDLIIRFGVDRDEDGVYDSYMEPGTLRFYNYSSDTLSKIVPDEINKDLQKIIQGNK